MNTFEDKLLAELRTVVAERPADIRRRRPKRLLIGIAACLTLAAGTAVAVPMLGSSSPAYAVVAQPDGRVRVTIYRIEDDKGLEKQLKAAGVDADVNFLPAGKTCRRTPAGKHPATDAYGVGIEPTDDGAWAFDFPRQPGLSLLITTGPKSKSKPLPFTILVTRLLTGTFGPCTPVDAPRPR
ncbi:hypothetical protein ACI2LF_04555 [Kribbella sp. NPDC020789]